MMVIGFRKFPITRKLMTMSMLATTGALFLASAGFLINELVSYRVNLIKATSNLADIIGVNSASAIVFNDAASVQTTLKLLESRPSVDAAAIYTLDGRVFASWRRDGRLAEAQPSLPGRDEEFYDFHGLKLDFYHPVRLDGTPIGVIYLLSNAKTLIDRMMRLLMILMGVLSISFLAALIIASKIGRRISAPILHLVEVARQVSEQKDYSVRATMGGSDEIALLIQTFNQMLMRIEEDGRSLKIAHDDLEKRVLERTAQLSAANRELEAFSYSVSHDLRTPLRAIDGFSRELQSQPALNDQGRSDLNRIRMATQRMAQLIDDLLNLSRVTRSEMKKEVVDLSVLAESITNDLKATEPSRPVEFKIQSGLTATVDRALMGVVFDNLLGNAWKFTSKQPKAIIEFGSTEQSGRRCFFVRDNGAGFNMLYADKLFGAFQRLHQTKDFPGTGVGLATVQRIIRRHGGEIWAEAAESKGATFFFTV